jgi:Mg2+-importing ATPase
VVATFAINVFFQRPAIEALLFAIALAVGMAPELLPAIISINLAKGAQVMAKSGVLVRRLSAIENLVSMDVLCTDKTGTLTAGVVQLDGALDVQGQPSAVVLRDAYLNAFFQTGLANALDEAILAKAQAENLAAAESKIDEIPYDFVRKRLSIVIEEEDGQHRLITKGALDNVLAVCTQVQEEQGSVPFDPAQEKQIRQRYAAWSAQGYRVLGVATKPVALAANLAHSDECDLIFGGFLIFFDPPKPSVEQTLRDLTRLGVQVKIITGDNRLVATHVAETVGLPVSGLLTGAEIGTMSDEALWQRAKTTTIFAEIDPNEKERIIQIGRASCRERVFFDV